MKKSWFNLFIFIFAIHSCPISVAALTKIECELVPIERSHSREETENQIEFPRRKKYNKNSSVSQNWCGYAAFPKNVQSKKQSVSEVSGTWTVPSVYASDSRLTYAAIWVGIDGYNSDTVEQIGTEHNFDVLRGRQINYAWFEMYPRSMMNLKNFPVEVGDVITARVKFVKVDHDGKSVFRLTLINRTKDVYYDVPKNHTTIENAKRGSAEWVMEAPATARDGILPLSMFDTFKFKKCTATINGKKGPINGAHWESVKINMTKNQNTTKATASRLSKDGKSFSVSWFHE